MKINAIQLRKIVLDEAAKFQKMQNVEDVEADETQADELADTIVAKKDFAPKCESKVALKKKLQQLELQEARIRVLKTKIINALTK